MEMLACNSKTTEAFGGTLRVDLGIYNANQAKLEEDIGAELGAKILAAVGPKQSMEMKVEATTAPRPPSAVVENSPKPAGESIVSPAPSNQRIQQRLAELGFSVGPADGVMGKRTTDALKRFQTNNGLSPNGQATAETLEKLMKK